MDLHWRPWRFRLRTLLAIAPLLAVVLGVAREVRNIRVQHELADKVYQLGGRVGVSSEELRWPAYGRFLAQLADEPTHPSIPPAFEPTSRFANGRTHDWSVYYQTNATVYRCWVGEAEFHTQPIVDADLSFLSAIDGLRSVRIERSLKLTDRAMSVIAQIHTLKNVTVLFTHISPAAIEQFRKNRPDVEVKYQPSIEFMHVE